MAAMAGALTVRFRVDFGGQCSIGVGKIELLEGIARTGSLSQAARQMRMSYRRAWLLLADLNLSFDQPVAHTSTGGRGGGGAVLTPFGVSLVAGYRRLESSLQPLAHRCLNGLGRRVLANRSKKGIHPASIRGRTSPG
jgi:molybdate transport system regulatory protein